MGAEFEDSIPEAMASLESILCTEELQRRPSRPPDYEKENRALVALVSALADSPSTILQTLAETILDITQCDSAGLSLLTRDDGGKRFYWPAIAGMWNPHVGGGTPRNFGPCGDVLDQNRTLLFRHFERRYPYLLPVIPAAEECLLVPFYVAGKAVGTIWAIMHSDRRKFDAEDDRVMGSLGKFASSAYQALVRIDDLKLQVAAREKAETELRELAEGLEAQVRVRTEELEQRNKEIAQAKAQLAEEKRCLERSEAYLAEAQRLSHTGSWHLNLRTGEVVWSQETFAILGLDSEKIKASYPLFFERIHPEDRATFDRVRSAAIGEKKDFEAEYRLLLPEGLIKYAHHIGHCFVSESGEIEYIGAVQDVTQRRLSEAALNKAQSELAQVARVTSLGVLTASIAHEVNQPLSGIITNANTCLRMLAADPPNLDGARETARRTIRDGERASEVIKRLRALFTKREATTESMDLNQAAREVIALSLSELQRNRVTLRPEFADDLPPVRGDRVQLQQVILNLLRNASDAMSGVDDRPRQLVIRTERDENDQVRLTVQDGGVGFETQDVNRLFEAFYTTKRGGMGIGLSVSRSIIESHQGRLWAAPNQGGPGATFAFSIPHGLESARGAEGLGSFGRLPSRMMSTR